VDFLNQLGAWLYFFEYSVPVVIINSVNATLFIVLVDAPWYFSNATLYADLGISYVQDAIHQKCNKHHTTLETYENPLL
jgi:hypothetical protein